MMICARVLGFMALLGACFHLQSSYGQVTNFANFEAKQVRPVSLSPNGLLLFAVNTADARLSVFDVSNPQNPILMAEIPVGVEPVSVNPRTDDEVWVVNEVSDTVSIVSVAQRAVVDTLYVPDEPGDVAFANGKAFVTASRNNLIRVFDANTRAALTNIAVLGEHPRSIVASADGSKVFAAFALSGNRTTIIPPDRAPPQPTNEMRSGLPAPPQVSLIVDATDPNWTTGANPVIRYTMPDNDVVEINAATLAITRYFPRVGTVNFGLAVRPGNGDLYVANTDARNLTRFEPKVRGAFVTNQVSRININSGAVSRYDLNPNFNYTNFPSLPDKTNALAQPTFIIFGPSGNNFYVGAYGSDRVALVDANTGTVTDRIELSPTAAGSAADSRKKRGPRGLALKPGTALYVLNRISNTITVIDPVTRAVIREIPVGSFDPTPAAIRQGRGFLYDTKLSGNGTVSCASCHIDSEMDLLAWDLGDPSGDMVTNKTVLPNIGTNTSLFHPMKGPMTTQTLRGLKGMDPLHWRGDRTNFLHFNGAFDSLLGGTVLPLADMQAYTAFINTISFQPNPNQNLDRTLPTSFGNGNPRAGFTNYVRDAYNIGLTCNTCHALPTGTAKFTIPAAALQESQDFKVPQLRNTYQKMRFNNSPGAQSVMGFGIVHDGMDPNLFTFLSRPVFGTFANNTTIKNNISAFVQCLDTGTAPCVGYTRTVTAANVSAAGTLGDWNLLEAQAVGQTNIDLVVKGTIDGKERGLLYQPASNQYRSDKTGLGPFTRAQLISKIQSGDKLTLMGVPPGSGYRMGIDRDVNGVLDGDVPQPTLQIATADSQAAVSWPLTASGFVLEKSGSISGTNWVTETSLRITNGSFLTITNTASSSNIFYRLRQL
jgi:YVTN family beta-propeller protein